MQNSSGAVSNTDHQGRRNRGFKDLLAWQRAMQMVLAVYELTAQFPIAERFGLSGQMRRAAISVPSNIAEGYGRVTTGEFKQFLGHARGSSAEVETQLMIAKKLHFGSDETIDDAERLCFEVSRLLTALMRSLKT
jgi:four helix bundle protein